MRQFAREFNELLRTEKFHGGVVGHSTGGLIAGLMLSYAPELFKGGFLLDPVGANGVSFDDAMTQIFEVMKTDKALTARVIGSTIKNVDPNHPYFTDIIVEDAYLAVKQVGVMVLRALSGFNAEAELAKIEKPFWVIHGQDDMLLPLEDSKKMSQLTKHGHFIVVPDAGHCLNYENPKKLSELLLDWQNHILH
jgi:pimeloyl-ACP methyl ester carboxylesterase